MLLRSLARWTGVATFLLALTALAAVPAAAQNGSNVDLITGTVTSDSGKAVVGATVEAYSLETQVTKRTTTNDKGRYQLFHNDGGGQYRITIKAIGMTPSIANVTRQQDDDRIVHNVRLGERPVVLQDITTRTVRAPQGDANERPTPGSTERNISADQASRLPIDGSDLAALAALVPGVIVTAGSDSTATSFQVAGQSGAANNIVVDGLSNGGSVPQDGVRNTRVITNTFDVSRGQFSGGQVSASTRGGSNVVQGSFSGNFQDRHLSWGGSSDNAFNAGQTTQQLGAGFGGPLKRDKLFLFGSFSVNRTLAPMASLDLANAATLGRLGVSADSVARFMDLAAATGLGQRVGSVDPNRTSDRFSGFLRFDWNAADRHTVTVRTDLNMNTSDPTRIGQTQLPQVGGNQDGSGGGVQLSIVSRLGVDFSNEFKFYGSTSTNESTPFLYVPVGRVQNSSDLGDGRFATTTFGFGGNSGLPQNSKNRGFELTNNFSWLPGGGQHRVQLGILANKQHFEQDVTNNRYGTYTYNSLADFQANTPASFTRTLQPTVREGSSFNGAIFLSDVWRPGRNLQFTVGGRFERSSFTGAPERNADAEARFGVRTDILPTETAFTPRLGFSWTIPAKEQQGMGQRGFAPPALVVRGGVGVFRGTMSNTLPGTAQAQAGLSTTETQLYCVGGAVPLPDWNAYANDPSLIPTQCINDASTPITTGRRTVTVYDDTYAAAKTIRANLGFSRRFTNNLNINVDASYVRGIDQAGSRDLNLVATPSFALAEEGGRPVYAAKDQIVTGTGAVPLTASRVDPLYGSVSSMFSRLENETKQVTLSLSTMNIRNRTFSLSYTMQFAKDQGGGFGNITAGDPNEFLWARSSNERRHNIQASGTWTFNQGLDVSLIGSLSSGSHYSPSVAGDVNGDGSRNDLAYVFNPGTAADPAVAAAMNRLLTEGSGAAAECLKSQLGKIAARNSCTGPWQPSLNAQMNWRPGMFDHRLQISFQTVNLLGGLDELINGADDLKGWGGFARPDQTLLQVRGFDAASNRFVYTVNERFGQTGGNATAVRSPFQLRVNMRYTIGQDRMRDMMRAGFGGQQRGANGQPQNNFVTQMLSNIPKNAAKVALERKDSLALDPRQVATLQAYTDSVDKAMAPLIAGIEEEAKKATASGDLQSLFPKLQPIMGALNADQVAAIALVKKTLTDVQWTLLPETAKTPQGLMRGPGQGGQQGPGGQRGGPGGQRGGGGE